MKIMSHTFLFLYDVREPSRAGLQKANCLGKRSLTLAATLAMSVSLGDLMIHYVEPHDRESCP